MRVIAGSAKGTRLGPVPRGVRPVSDRVREGMFSSLGDAVRDARALDLYAGTGALGIEALSRGAAEVTFVERSPQGSAAILDNLRRAHLEDRATVVGSEVRPFLRAGRVPDEGIDLILCDPPYELGPPELDEVLADLGARWLSDAPWTVVLTRGRQSSTPVIPLHWVVARQLAYGDSLVVLFREVRWA